LFKPKKGLFYKNITCVWIKILWNQTAVNGQIPFFTCWDSNGTCWGSACPATQPLKPLAKLDNSTRLESAYSVIKGNKNRLDWIFSLLKILLHPGFFPNESLDEDILTG